MKKNNQVFGLSTSFALSIAEPSLWLLGIASGLIAIHLNLVSQANDGSLMASSLLYWFAIAFLIWSRRETLNLESSPLASIVGMMVLALVLLKSAFISGYDPFLRVSPLLTGLGLGLLASGFKGLGQYWKELAILAFLAPPPSALSEIFDTSPITARFSTLLLWYSGWDVVRQGVYIILPFGAVEVYSGCSGIDTMLHLLGLAMLFMVMFPTDRIQKVLLPIVAILIAFVVNGIRVAIMALLSAPASKSAFEYWHKGNGSLLFSMVAVLLLGIYCFFILGQQDSEFEDSEVEDFEVEQMNGMEQE